MMKAKRYRVVLVRPEDGANVGAVCRAMKTMGLDRLLLVDTAPNRLDIERVKQVSVHAWDIFETAEHSAGLDAALETSVLAAGFTRRRGRKRKYISYTPEQFVAKAARIPSGEVSLVFGNERTGLTEEELNCCNCAVAIPTDRQFPSLNLSHAVQIITYLLFREKTAETADRETDSPGSSGEGERENIVTRKELEIAVASMTNELERIGFFTLTGREEMKRFLFDMYARSLLSPEELKRLKSLFKKIGNLKINRE